LININTSSITLAGNYTATSFDNTAQNYYMNNTTYGASFKIGDFILYDRGLTDEEVSLVEQYLVKKWSINSTSPPPPSELGIWFDASDLTSLTWDVMDNYRVTSWSNKGSVGNIAYPGGYLAPQTQLESQNGLNVVSFNQNPSPGFDSLYLAPFNIQSGNKTCAMVFRLEADLTSYTPTRSISFLQANPGNNPGDFALVFAWFDGTNFVATVNAVYGFPVFGNIPNITGEYVLITLVAVQDPASPDVGIWLNGSNINRDFIRPSENSSALIPYVLGGGISQGPTYNLGELRMYYRSFDVTERQTLEGQLAWKWGLESSLPVDHPYYNFPPPS
jgi:hypothetical protein